MIKILLYFWGVYIRIRETTLETGIDLVKGFDPLLSRLTK